MFWFICSKGSVCHCERLSWIALFSCCHLIKSTLEWRLCGFFKRPPEASVLQALYSLQGLCMCVCECVCLRQLTHKSSLQKGLLRAGSRRYSLSPRASGWKWRAYQAEQKLIIVLGYSLSSPEKYANQQRDVRLFLCFVSASSVPLSLLKCIRFCWSHVKCLLSNPQ